MTHTKCAPPPAAVAVHRNGNGPSDVYYSLYPGWRLNQDALDELEKVLTTVAVEPPVLTERAGFAFLPRQKAEDLRQDVERIVRSGMAPDGLDDLPETAPARICGVLLDPYEVAK